MMKKIILILFVGLTTMSNGLIGQDSGARRGKVLELNKAFLQENLVLSNEEMAEFWPIHVNYVTERRSVKNAMKEIRNQVKDNDKLSETEFVNLVDQLSDLRMDEIKNDKSYAKSVVAIIGVNKYKELKPLAKEFKEEMRKKRDSRNGGQGKSGREGTRPAQEGHNR